MLKNSTSGGNKQTWESGCKLFELVLGQVGAIEGVSDNQVREVNDIHFIHNGVTVHSIDAQHHQDTSSEHNPN